MTDRPLIEWTNVGAPYRLWLICEGKVLWSRGEIEENRLRSPIDLSGECWAIVVNDSGSSLDESPTLGGVGFIVPAARQRDEVLEKGGKLSGLERARYLHDRGYHAAALEAIEALQPSPVADALAARIWAYYVSIPPKAIAYARRALQELPERSPEAEEMREIIRWAENLLPRAAN